MGFWDNVNDELKKAMGEGWSAVKENAKIGKLRLKISSLHRKAEKNFSEIGGKVYEMANRTGEAGNPLVAKDIIQLIEEIRATEAEVSEIEALIAKMRSREAAAGAKAKAAGAEKDEPAAEEEAGGQEGSENEKDSGE